MQVRDGQKSKLYKAEHEAFRGYVGRDVSTQAKYQARVDEITGSQWMRDATGVQDFKIRVRFSSRIVNRATIFTRFGRIETGMQPAICNEWVLVHELSHLAHDYTTKWDHAAHGRQFADLYLAMVSRFLGVEWHDRLKASFRKHGVKYKRRKKISEETRAKLAARLKAIREAKQRKEDDELLAALAA